jgi:hypothetical protein
MLPATATEFLVLALPNRPPCVVAALAEFLVPTVFLGVVNNRAENDPIDSFTGCFFGFPTGFVVIVEENYLTNA